VHVRCAGVFFGSDFVTVTKSDDYNWPVLKPDIFAAIMDHFSSGDPLFTDKEALEASDTAIHEDDDEVRTSLLCVGGCVADGEEGARGGASPPHSWSTAHACNQPPRLLNGRTSCCG
jgi:hypothetical protein